MLTLPFIFVHEECAAGIQAPALWIYAIYAALTAIWEVFTVLKIQRVCNNKEILDFNLWHGTELVMGQVAHLDTYLDMCFLSLVYRCEMWGLVIPITCFIILMQSYPIFTIFSLCKVKKTLAHTQPYLERNCHLSFIRENMLLATVLDRFAINNTVTIRGKPIAYGKFNGGWTFMCQDLP